MSRAARVSPPKYMEIKLSQHPHLNDRHVATPYVVDTGPRRKIMSNTNSKSDDHRELTDIELDAVTGGKLIDAATPKLYEAALKGKVFTKVEIHGTA